jgi:hypothetical protein
MTPGLPPHSSRERRRARRATNTFRNTVLLATVLFLTALAQKFKLEGVRIGLAGFPGSCSCSPSTLSLRIPRAEQFIPMG